MSRPGRRLRQAMRPRPGIPFALTIPEKFRMDAAEAAAIRRKVREAQRTGNPLIVGNGIQVIPMGGRR